MILAIMRNIVAVHGVGSPSPGSIAGQLARLLNFGRAEQEVVWSEGQSFVRISDRELKTSVLEVNWSHLNTAGSTFFALARYVVYLVTSMVDVAARPFKGRRMPFASLYRAALFSLGPGAVALVVATSVGFAIINNGMRRAALVALTAGLIALTAWLQRLGRHYLLLWPWVVAVAAVAIMTIQHPLTSDTAIVISKGSRLLAFLASMLALDAAGAESIIQRRGQPAPVHLSYLALLYIPYILMNSLMVWVTLIAFGMLSRFSPPEIFLQLQRFSTPDGLDRIEWASTLVIGGLGIAVLVIPLLRYFTTRSGSHDTSSVNQRGRAAQNGVLWLLAIAPVSLLALQIYVVWVGLQRQHSSVLILQIYETSVMRTLPLIGWFYGPFGVVLRIVGDVLFYLQPNELHPTALSKKCRTRLLAALAYVSDEQHGSAAVIAHSQGSVIATDLRHLGALECPLLTLGSPVESLYLRFLGIDFESDQRNAFPWKNEYRDGDYIGGPIRCLPVGNQNIGAGGHTDYWEDPRIRVATSELFAVPAKAIEAS